MAWHTCPLGQLPPHAGYPLAAHAPPGVSVGVAAGGVGVGVTAPLPGHVPAAASLTRNLLPSPVPTNVMQYVFVPPSRVSTTSMVAAPFGTASGAPVPTALSRPHETLATLATDGPLGASGFLYLKTVAEPLALQSVFGSARLTGPLPSLKLTEESAPPTGSDPATPMLGSFDSSTNFPLLSRSFLPVMPWSVARAMPTPNTAMLAAAATTVMKTLRSLGLSILSSVGPEANPPRMDG